MRNVIVIMLSVALCLGFATAGFADSPAAMQQSPVRPTTEWVNFYSENSTLSGAPIPVGSVVWAYDASGNVCGEFVVHTAGEFGLMACYLDDPTTPVDEGVEPGDLVRFTVNGLEAGQSQLPTSIQKGDRFEVELSAEEAWEIPEPATLLFLGSGLAGLAGYVRLRSRKRRE